MRTFLFILSILLLSPAAYAADFSGLPPVVVKTEPANGASNVDPSLKELRVTFSKPMLTREMWSWVIHTPDTAPQIIGKPRYLSDQRTNVVAVKLKPNRTYAIWFNSPNGKFIGFRDRNKTPAVPYLLVFRTGN